MRICTFWICMVYTVLSWSQSVPSILLVPDHEAITFYNLDNLPEDINLGSPGSDNVWNFSLLRSPVALRFNYKAASKGKYAHLFPEATLVLRDPWGIEKYFKVDNSGYRTVGEVLPARSKGDQVLIKNYEIAGTSWSLDKINKRERYNSIMWTVVLDSYQMKELGLNRTKDIKIEVNEDIVETLDASGVMYLPNSVENASRIRRQKNTEVALYEKQDDQWVAIDVNIIEEIPLEIPRYVEEYIFVDLDSQIELASVAINEYGSPSSVLYKSTDIESAKSHSLSSGKQFVLHPSTTFGDIRLDFIGYPPGNYRLEISNVIGRKVWTQNYTINSDKTLKEDLSFLPKGTYQYALLDEQYNRILVRRLAIIKP